MVTLLVLLLYYCWNFGVYGWDDKPTELSKLQGAYMMPCHCGP